MDDRPPNLLFILPDQQRWDWGPWNDCLDIRTPNLARLADRGVRFANAITSSPLCAPARACLASGRNYWRCGVGDNFDDTPLDGPFFYRNLRDAGYEVCAVGKVDLHKGTADWKTDGSSWLERWGFTRGIDSEGKHVGVITGAEEPAGPYMAMLHRAGWAETHAKDLRSRHFFLDTRPTPLPEDLYSDNWIAGNCLSVLDQVEVGTPWFMQINYTGPHQPNDVTRDMWDSVQGRSLPGPVESTEFEPADHQRIRQNYTAMVENIDRHTGRILDAIEARGELENTIVVYSSDHGEMLGDHDSWQKSNYHDGALRIPLVFAGPGIAGGRVSDALAQFNDLGPTFLDLAGAAPLAGADGKSLRPILEGRARGLRDHSFSGLIQRPPRRATDLDPRIPVIWFDVICDGRYKLVDDHISGSQLLFDGVNDPHELENILGKEPSVADRLLSALNRQVSLGTHGPAR